MSIVTCRTHLFRDFQSPIPDRPTGNVVNYLGGSKGPWLITKMTTRSGAPLKPATHVEIVTGPLPKSVTSSPAWVLPAAVSSTRYITREESSSYKGIASPASPAAGTPKWSATLLLIRKSNSWWELARSDRREIVEARSKLVARHNRLLPTIARRFQRQRYLGEPFDFLTWFEYSSNDKSFFDELTGTIRDSEEWYYVDREVDVRLEREIH